MLRSIKKSLLLTVGVSALMTGTASYAADEDSATLEEVVVTAERRVQDVQKIAASVSVRTGEDLAAQGRYTLAQILENIPGVQGGETGTIGGGSGTDARASGVVIRGIRSNTGAAGSITSVGSSAAAYTDDVYQGIGGNYDIGRVEVLRGPQGTLYGRSAVSGAVGTYTNNPSLDKFGGSVTGEWGGNDVGAQSVWHYTGAVNMPLTDTIAVRAAADRYTRGGTYVDRSTNDTYQTAAKLKVLWQPNEDLSLLVAGAFEDNKVYNGSTGITGTQPQLDNVVITRTAITSYYPGTNKHRQIWAKLDWNLDWATLTYIPAMRNFRNDQITDIAATNASMGCGTRTSAQLAAAGVRCFIQPTSTPFDQFDTHEIRLASNPDQRLTWQAGGMYYLNRLRNHSDTEWINPVDGRGYWQDSCLYPPANYTNGVCKRGETKYNLYTDTEKKTQAIGAFAEATYKFTDAFRFTGGLRYDHTKVTTRQFYYTHAVASCIGDTGLYVDLGAVGVTGCTLLPDSGIRTFKNTTYKARVEYDVSPQHLLYAGTSTGASPGDAVLSTGANSTPQVLSLKSQTLTSYDIGSKNRFYGDKLQVNGEIYFQDYGGYQQADINISQSSDSIFTTIVTPVKFYGFDAELLYQLTPKDRLGLNVGYTHGWFVDRDALLYVQPASTTPPLPAKNVYLKDVLYFETVHGIPPYTVNLNYDHNFDLRGGSRLVLHGDVRYTTAFNPANLSATLVSLGTAPYGRQGNAHVFNANANWTTPSGMFSVNTYVRNLFDNRYKTGGSNGCSVTPTGTSCSQTTTGSVAQPRSFGVTATVNF